MNFLFFLDLPPLNITDLYPGIAPSMVFYELVRLTPFYVINTICLSVIVYCRFGRE